MQGEVYFDHLYIIAIANTAVIVVAIVFLIIDRKIDRKIDR